MEERLARAADGTLQTWVERPGALYREIYEASGSLDIREAGLRF